MDDIYQVQRVLLINVIVIKIVINIMYVYFMLQRLGFEIITLQVGESL